MVVLGVLLDILCWRRRSFARLIPYYEGVSNIIQGFVPFNYGDFSRLILLTTILFVYASVCCDLKPNIIYIMVTLNVMQFVQVPYLYKEEWSGGLVLANLLNTFFCFTILTVFNMLLTYIAVIRSKLAQLIVENLNLLDRMHEGLIVMSETQKELQLASKPAI